MNNENLGVRFDYLIFFPVTLRKKNHIAWIKEKKKNTWINRHTLKYTKKKIPSLQMTNLFYVTGLGHERLYLPKRWVRSFSHPPSFFYLLFKRFSTWKKNPRVLLSLYKSYKSTWKVYKNRCGFFLVIPTKKTIGIKDMEFEKKNFIASKYYVAFFKNKVDSS